MKTSINSQTFVIQTAVRNFPSSLALFSMYTKQKIKYKEKKEKD